MLARFRELKQHPDYDKEELLDLYRQGDPETVKLIDDSVATFTTAVYNAIVSYGPQEIYLNSPFLEKFPDITKKFRQQLNSLHIDLPIHQIGGSGSPSLLGTASLIIHHILEMDDYSLKFKWPKEIAHSNN